MIIGFSIISGSGLLFLLWTYTKPGKRWLRNL